MVTGTVVGTDSQAPDNVRSIIEVLDDTPAFTKELLELTRRVSEYYLCSWGEVLDASLPSGLTPTSVITVEVVRFSAPQELETMASRAPKRAELLSYLQETTTEHRVGALQKRFGTAVPQQLDALQRHGHVSLTTEVEAQKGPRTIKAVRVHQDLLSDDDRLKSTFDELDKRAPKQSLVLGYLYVEGQNQESPFPVTQLVAQLGVSTAVVSGLEDKGLVEVSHIPKPREDDPFDVSLATVDESTVDLTTDQKKIVDDIRSHRGFSTHLIEGVTGSGKTLIYMELMHDALKKNQRALLLVPEIALTPQLHDRFRAVFGDRVALLHSRLAVGERIQIWQEIRDGKIDVVIGPRSSVFAPIKDLGIVVVDEEHEPSYKQDDPAPRYHGRDVAIMRAQIEQCPVVLGSATPSLESLHNARSGRYTHHVLSKRVDDATLPKRTIIDLRASRTSGTLNGTITNDLLNAVKERVERKEGVILFLNRRGFSTQMQCVDCGSAPQCPNCDVTLTWHKHAGQLRCHYCGHKEPAHTSCTTCGSMELTELGTGTQRVEEDVRAQMEGTGAVIERMDADTMRKKGAHRRLLERFSSGDVDVIVGTQMVAKGLDIPRVTLVGIINADQSLFQSGFRSTERTAQLITQVSGRAGRHPDRPGEVIIQTSNPDHPAISTEDWLEPELALRKETNYPPFSRFITIELSGPKLDEVEHVAMVLDRLLPIDDPSMVRFTPVAPPIARIRNRYRRVIVIKNPKDIDPSGRTCRGILESALERYANEYAVSSVRVTVDVDASGAF